MPIKARPFKTKVDEVPIEGLIEADSFVFRFYDLISFRVPVTTFGEDVRGGFAILRDTEIEDTDGFVFSVEEELDSDLGSKWGYEVCLKRSDPRDKELFHGLLKLKGINPEKLNLIIPPRQSISVYFNQSGEVEDSRRLEPVIAGSETVARTEGILDWSEHLQLSEFSFSLTP